MLSTINLLILPKRHSSITSVYNNTISYSFHPPDSSENAGHVSVMRQMVRSIDLKPFGKSSSFDTATSTLCIARVHIQ